MFYDVYFCDTNTLQTLTEDECIDMFGLSEWYDILDGKVANLQAFRSLSKVA